MANRFRNERIEIKVTKEEKDIFYQKMRLSKSKSMSHFLRKCVLEKEIYIVDLEPFRSLQYLLPMQQTTSIKSQNRQTQPASSIKTIFNLSEILWMIYPEKYGKFITYY